MFAIQPSRHAHTLTTATLALLLVLVMVLVPNISATADAEPAGVGKVGADANHDPVDPQLATGPLVAADSLGRVIADADTARAPQLDRTVGIF